MSPSRSTECRKCDSLLVAYCDRELEPKLRTWVDEHVVACKPCGIELSRIELETLRLREALVPMEPSLDFTSRVMDSVRDVVASDGLVEPPASLVGKGFTSRILDQVREDLGVPPAPKRWGRSRVAALALAAAVLLCALALPFLLSEPAPERQTTASWFVVRAENAGPFQRGDALTLPLRVDLADGLLELEHGSEGSGWKIGVEGEGRFSIDPKGIRLEDGELVAWSEAARAEELAIDLPGGHSLSLRAGRYQVRVQDVEQDALMAGLNRISVRVFDGVAGFRQLDGTFVQLGKGSIGTLEPLRRLEIQRLPTESMLAKLDAQGRRNPSRVGEGDRDRFVLSGDVREGQASEVVAGALVELHAGDRVVRTRTDEEGQYELRIDLDGVAPEDVWMAAHPPAERRDLAKLEYRAFREAPTPGRKRFENLRLESARPASGRLVGPDGAALAGARIRALRIDSFFGGARLVSGVDVESGRDGSFTLPAMSRERSGESTALLIESPDSSVPPHVEYCSTDCLQGEAPLQVRVDGGSLAQLPVQNAATRVVWVEKRPSGVAASYWRQFERIELPAAGSSTLQVRLAPGATLRWWEDAGAGVPSKGFEGALKAAGSSEVALLAAAPQPVGAPAMRSEPVAGETVAFAALATLSPSGFGRDAPRASTSRADATEEATNLSLQLFHDGARAPSETLVYVRVADGRPWFAGRTDVGGNIVVRDLPRNSSVQVFAMSGQDMPLIATARYRTDRAEESHRLAMRATRGVFGRLPLLASAQHARVTVLDGPFEGFEICAGISAEGQLRLEDLPPGALRVDVDERFLEVDGGVAQLPNWDSWKKRASDAGAAAGEAGESR